MYNVQFKSKILDTKKCNVRFTMIFFKLPTLNTKY